MAKHKSMWLWDKEMKPCMWFGLYKVLSDFDSENNA